MLLKVTGHKVKELKNEQKFQQVPILEASGSFRNITKLARTMNVARLPVKNCYKFNKTSMQN